MKCPACGAEVDSAYCGYCGSKMPVERVETQTFNGEHVEVHNHYYYQQPGAGQQQGQAASGQHQGQTGGWQRPQPTTVNYNVSLVSNKSRLVALLLCFFLGVFGVHRFYVGRYGLGILFFFTFGLLGIGYLVDLVWILVGKLQDGNHLYVVNW